ncbi:MAG: efflux RND transporter periplasmic adaptor subunit [Phycisphaerae bacterium]|nr:efflux RND transporter periplasmic adaptor subunit [Phycisphaerae bacterium]MDD5380079.1 efflux RND transporter periplasmic adaptor subunit [Phycisphaerae bacterium]
MVLLSKKSRWLFLLLIAVFLAGYAIYGSRQSGKAEPAAGGIGAQQQQWWTCAMHPQIHQPKPGKCPICFMDLIPVASSGEDVGARQIVFSEDALKLMEVQTTPVERKLVEAEVRMAGKVEYDESRVKEITAWVPGRIDRLYVDFTGTLVRKGDHMVYFYSPQLLSAQAELLQAAKAAQESGGGATDLMRRSGIATLEAAREKLRLLGLQKEQIEEIEKTGKPVDHLTIYAPIGGIVIAKHANAGDYVETGTKIYTIADLSEVWVKLDAYELDLAWLRYGQQVEFTTEAYPGEMFKGTISFIDPVLNPMTRTVKLRVNVANPDGRLKPEMFVRAVVRSKVAGAGRVMDEDMAGKWICPMHPSIVKTRPGKCDICGMDLVTTESLGYVTAAEPNEAPLVIPASAPLITGTRAVVYVRLADKEKPTFESREIVLGSRAGDYYLVKEGLAEGEMIVTNGNFKIDSALQIQAKPSMMNPQGGAAPMGHQHGGDKMEQGMNMPGM